MSYGRLGVGVLALNTALTVYTVPVNCLWADITVDILNGQSADATVQLSFGTNSPALPVDYIENGVILPSSGGGYSTDGCLSPGEKIIVTSNVAGLVVRVSGKEITKI